MSAYENSSTHSLVTLSSSDSSEAFGETRRSQETTDTSRSIHHTVIPLNDIDEGDPFADPQPTNTITYPNMGYSGSFGPFPTTNPLNYPSMSNPLGNYYNDDDYDTYPYRPSMRGYNNPDECCGKECTWKCCLCGTVIGLGVLGALGGAIYGCIVCCGDCNVHCMKNQKVSTQNPDMSIKYDLCVKEGKNFTVGDYNKWLLNNIYNYKQE